ncbi:MAG TPA: glycosyltransferase family 2 protein [Burkholderiaceae bacterium]|nr:glycosyltransferase family 2 protein [Burkholderiaceae bacterium]
MTTLSVIIITKNEAAHIAACIDSVAFADEIVVVDSGSTDDTVKIAQDKGAHVVVTDDWPGFGPQKNRALNLASKEWVLSIDADERVTPQLALEIQGVLQKPTAQAYEIARQSQYCGRWMKHSGWWPDYILRLFKRDVGRFTDAAVHEKVVVNCAPQRLKEHFLHYPYANLEEHIDKLNRYSSDAAIMMREKGRATSPLGAAGHAFWTFIRIYFLRRGFLDGRQGFTLAMMASAGSFFRYTKLLYPDQTKR